MYGFSVFNSHAVSALSLSTDEKNPFNIIRASLLTGRSMVLGGRSAKGEPVPSKPWMGFQNYVRHVCVHSLLRLCITAGRLAHNVCTCAGLPQPWGLGPR